MTRSTTHLSAQGAWEVKRRFTLPGMSHERDAQVIAKHLGRLSGVSGTAADIGRHRLKVVYDTTQLVYLQVLEALEEVGFPTSDGRWARIKANWFQFLDVNGRENANAPEAPCCNNPKGIAKPKK
ncbi:MAG: heavy-metal-associated domain-containing protein [Pseudomonadota bacterium]|nr:heavy-metal-associated domain-containing protein [Pseudomonadota bacterium]